MMTVPEAAARVGKDPETIRRWIRSGRLKASKVGAQHVIEEADLDSVLPQDQLAAPSSWGWDMTADGRPMPDVVALVRCS